MKKVLPYWPVAVAAFAIISAGLTAQFQIQLNKMEIEDLSESVDDNEAWLSDIQWQLDELG